MNRITSVPMKEDASSSHEGVFEEKKDHPDDFCGGEVPSVSITQ